MSNEKQRQQQREAMERSRFGATREEVFREKGAECANCGSKEDLVIDHIAGGGRHHTERGLIVEGKTHSMENLQVLCRSCAGARDRMRDSMGMGIEGNPNNPS